MKTLVLVLVGCCLSVATISAQDVKPFWPAYGVLVAGNVADLVTTKQAFDRGAVEGNGFLQGSS